MSKLAIKGHETKGCEVIEILETIGGENSRDYVGDLTDEYYFIDENGEIECDKLDIEATTDYCLHSLETFKQLYPFQIGEQVKLKIYGDTYNDVITKIMWDEKTQDISYYFKVVKYPKKAYELEIDNTCIQSKNLGLTKKKCIIINDRDYDKEVELIFKNREIIYRDGKIFLVKVREKYPTFEECCEKFGYGTKQEIGNIYMSKLFKDLSFLIQCRDAYWKIDEFKPNNQDNTECYYTIKGGFKVKLYNYSDEFAILSFPTVESRDTFYEKFKKIIENCKEFL